MKYYEVYWADGTHKDNFKRFDNRPDFCDFMRNLDNDDTVTYYHWKIVESGEYNKCQKTK